MARLSGGRRPAPPIGFRFDTLFSVASQIRGRALRDWPTGVDIVGQVHPSGVSKKRIREPQLEYDVWKAQIPSRNRAMIHRVVSSNDTEMSRIFWETTLVEASKGWVTAPAQVTVRIVENFPISPRSPIKKNHGGRAKKVRIIDDFEESKVGDLLGLVDSSLPSSVDVFLSTLLMRGHFRPAAEIVSFPVDFPHACNHVGSQPISWISQ